MEVNWFGLTFLNKIKAAGCSAVVGVGRVITGEHDNDLDTFT